jgi:hypothetical protein
MNDQGGNENDTGKRDIGVQTLLRESETQTMPYTPKEYVLPGTYPEVLKISHFKYGKQLPPTLGWSIFCMRCVNDQMS